MPLWLLAALLFLGIRNSEGASMKQLSLNASAVALSSGPRRQLDAKCGNEKEQCAHWAKAGKCVGSPVMMAKNCAAACGLCAPGTGSVAEHWVFVANTPKTGTGTLQSSFLDSSGCVPGADSEFALRGVYVNHCARGNVVLRTHHLQSAATFLTFLQSTYASPGSTTAKCLVITGVRDPRSWLPSVYFENNKQTLCHPTSDASPAIVIQSYRRWLAGTEARQLATRNYEAPGILRAFGQRNFTAFMRQRLLPRDRGPTPAQPLLLGAAKGDAVAEPWASSRCELLVMRLEEAGHWPAQLAAAAPGFRWRPGPSTTARCPGPGAAAYEALKAYVPTAAEVQALRGMSSDFDEAWHFHATEFPSRA